MATNCNLFRRTVLKKWGRINNCSFWLVSGIFDEFQHPAINQNSAALFLSNKSAPANRKKGLYTNRDPNKQVGFILL
jgi:hypothetical protein